MKPCGHEHVTVEGCDTCYIVVLKKRVARLLAAEHKRLDRIAALEAVMKELADDVEAYAGVEFSGRDIWPTYQRKWELAMDVVNRARALLGGGDE